MLWPQAKGRLQLVVQEVTRHVFRGQYIPFVTDLVGVDAFAIGGPLRTVGNFDGELPSSRLHDGWHRHTCLLGHLLGKKLNLKAVGDLPPLGVGDGGVILRIEQLLELLDLGCRGLVLDVVFGWQHRVQLVLDRLVPGRVGGRRGHRRLRGLGRGHGVLFQ